MTDQPFYDPQVFRRNREIREPGARPGVTNDSQDLNEITQNQLRGLFDGFAFQINRATLLLAAVEPVAQKLTIPVDSDATRVKAAIRRKYPDSADNIITFDMYKDMLEFRQKIADRWAIEFVGEFTGDLLTDGTKLKKFLKTGGRGLSDFENFLLEAESLLLWMVLHQVMNQFEAPEEAASCAAKQPAGTETFNINLRMAIAMAVMMDILGLSRDHVIFALEKPANALGIPPVDIINRARRLIDTDFHREVNEILGADDHNRIIEYADNYIARNALGYESWIAYRDVLNIRKDATITYIHAPQYSGAHWTALDFSSEHKHVTPTVASGGLLSGLGIGRKATVQYVPLADMSVGHFDALAGKLVSIDINLSLIGGVISSQFAYDVLCCVARFFNKQDIDRLRRLRGLLTISTGSIRARIANLLSLGSTNIMDLILTRLWQEMLEFVERIFQNLVCDIQEWIGNKLGDALDDLFYCPLIEDLVTGVYQAIQHLEREFNEILNKFVGRMDKLYGGTTDRWFGIYESKRYTILVNLIDRIIDTIEYCAQYNLDVPDIPVSSSDNDIPPILRDLAPSPIRLPDQVVQKFFPNTNYIRREGGIAVPPVNHTVTSSTDVAARQNFRDLCRGILPDDIIEATVTDEVA